MYERMLNKNIVPSENDIKEHIGKKSFENKIHFGFLYVLA